MLKISPEVIRKTTCGVNENYTSRERKLHVAMKHATCGIFSLGYNDAKRDALADGMFNEPFKCYRSVKKWLPVGPGYATGRKFAHLRVYADRDVRSENINK